uniref:Uncharacterized protein n=1 Tax=Arundo donax TaxID=35708 RepID=A0A0A9AS39_ARUDO
MLPSMKISLAEVVFPELPSPKMEAILIFCWSLVCTSLDIIWCFSWSLPTAVASSTICNDGISPAVLIVCRIERSPGILFAIALKSVLCFTTASSFFLIALILCAALHCNKIDFDFVRRYFGTICLW